MFGIHLHSVVGGWAAKPHISDPDCVGVSRGVRDLERSVELVTISGRSPIYTTPRTRVLHDVEHEYGIGPGDAREGP